MSQNPQSPPMEVEPGWVDIVNPHWTDESRESTIPRLYYGESCQTASGERPALAVKIGELTTGEDVMRIERGGEIAECPTGTLYLRIPTAPPPLSTFGPPATSQ